MVTVFDLLSGETESLTGATRRKEAPAEPAPIAEVAPRLQEHVFSEPLPPQTLPVALAQLDCETFLRKMEKP